jgi:hypothetical protein
VVAGLVWTLLDLSVGLWLMDEVSIFRRYRRQPAAQKGSAIYFDSEGRMFDVRDNPQLADFEFIGRVVEVDEQGMLIAFTSGQEPPERT